MAARYQIGNHDPAPYTGVSSHELFWLVGRGSPNERLFVRTDLDSATQYAIDNSLSIISVKGSALPASAVEEVLAASG